MSKTITDLDGMSGVTAGLAFSLDDFDVYTVLGPGYEIQIRIKNDGSGLGHNSEDQASLDSYADSVEHQARIDYVAPAAPAAVSFKAELQTNVSALDSGTATVEDLINAILDAESGSNLP